MASGGGGDDPTKSTTSVLGDIIKEYGLDKDNDLDLASAVGDPNDPVVRPQQPQQQQQQQVVGEVIEGPDGNYITVVPQIVDSTEELVFNLIQDSDSNPAAPSAPSASAAVTNFVVQEGGQLVATAPASVKQETEGEKIMASLTGFGALPPPPPSAAGAQIAVDPATGQPKASVVILEQPAENKLRFRYECEGRSAGALHGENTTADNKTCPTIQIVGYQGPAVCVVSLVEDKQPHRAHPHNLVGKDGSCKHGVCSVTIDKPDMTYAFQNLGIQCVRKKDAPESLDKRQQIKVDPFKQGFSHKGGPIDLNCVRLCFQVFLKTSRGLVPLAPVVSSVIKDRKAHSDLQILEYSDDRCSVDGGKKILLFCEKVSKDDIEVHFTQYTKGGEQFAVKGDFTANDVHKQYGIALRTPPYVNKDITEPVQCSMFLYKPKSKACSEPVDFWYIPCSHVNDANNILQQQQRQQQQQQHQQHQQHNDLNQTPVIKPVKRGRAPKPASSSNQQQDDSSGQIAVPSKQQAPINNWGGGQVVQQQQQQQQQDAAYYGSPQNNLDSPQQFSPGAPATSSSRSPYEQVTIAEGGAGLTMRPVVQQAGSAVAPPPGPQGPQATPVQVPQQDDKAANDMTEDLQAMLRGGQASAQQAAASPGMTHLNAFLQTDTGASAAAAVAAMEETNDTSLQNLNLNPGDLGPVGGSDVENLSSNLDSNLKIGGNKASAAGTANNLGDPGQGFLRQTSQLHTPDVSMSVEDASKRNNLNR